MSMGETADETRLTSAYVESRVFPGSLHAFFKPIHAHPLLDEYSIWVTAESRTVVAIRGRNAKLDDSFAIGPKPFIRVSGADNERERRAWKKRRRVVQQILSDRVVRKMVRGLS